MASLFAGDPPTDLDRRRERSVKGHSVQAHIPNERGVVGNLDRPKPEAALVELGLDALGECIARPDRLTCALTGAGTHGMRLTPTLATGLT